MTTRLEDIENKDIPPVTANLEDTRPQTAANYGMFFTAGRPCEVVAVVEKHGTKGTDASAVTLQIEKLTGTTVKGSGTLILTTAFDLKGNNYTYVLKKEGDLVKAFTSSVSPVQLEVGDSLALKYSGVLTDLKDLQVTVYLKPRGKGDYRL